MINSYLKIVRAVVLVAMPVTAIASLVLFFQIIQVPNSEEGGQLLFVFNYESWSKIDVTTLYFGIITTSSAIVAIGFSINHITMTKIFESYNSRKFELFFKKQKILDAFIVLIIIIISSSIFLFLTNALDERIQFLLASYSLTFFIYSLWMFFESFFNNFKLINKFTMLDTIESDILERIENETD